MTNDQARDLLAAVMADEVQPPRLDHMNHDDAVKVETREELVLRVAKITAQARLDVVGGKISGWHCRRARENHERGLLLAKLWANQEPRGPRHG